MRKSLSTTNKRMCKMSWSTVLCYHHDDPIQLVGTLNGGQSFRWTHDKEKDEWTGVFSKTIWKLKQDGHHLLYQVKGSLLGELDCSRMLKKYFRLNVTIKHSYKRWSEKDELFKTAYQQLHGIRMLHQEPVENLFSFICSQNNHISRISSMVEKLCEHFGEEISIVDDVAYYSFPEVEKLAKPEVEAKLRELGFGYRAKFIQKSAAQIVEWGGIEWFNSLQDMTYKDARQELMKLYGIGPKVADCICLMSLNHLEAIPVDTHVYQIAARNYLPHLRGKKNVTEKMYMEIGDHFRNLFGEWAGWAHTVLFCADLKKLQQKENDSEEPKQKKKRKK
ncbi:N-glycosylase/DNA lyase [Ostrinia nubilalis]|uniref:N-glycosylase/DNA lyase n=1 Tax=Ostrinia nubilalis TaxID=29057 RepID=UPI00308224A8